MFCDSPSFLEVISTHFTMQCFKCIFHMDNHTDMVGAVTFVDLKKIKWYTQKHLLKKSHYFFFRFYFREWGVGGAGGRRGNFWLGWLGQNWGHLPWAGAGEGDQINTCFILTYFPSKPLVSNTPRCPSGTSSGQGLRLREGQGGLPCLRQAWRWPAHPGQVQDGGGQPWRQVWTRV